MKRLIEFIKTTLLGGALIVVPAAAIAFILIKVARGVRHALDPVASQLPASVQFPYVIEVVTVIAACFIAGLIIRTRPGRVVGKLIEHHMFEKLPGYSMAKALTGRSVGGTTTESATPCLVDMEDGLVPALIIERHDDGYFTVFVPSPPVPTVGQSYIFGPDKVHPVDMSLPKFVGCITRWGLGAREMRQAIRK